MRLLKVKSALVVEKTQIAEDVGLDLLRLRLGIDLLKIVDDLLHRVLAVTTLNDFETWAVQTQSAFGHEQNMLLLVVLAEAATGSEARPRLQVRCHASLVLMTGQIRIRRTAKNGCATAFGLMHAPRRERKRRAVASRD